jgi:hypothetical protein
MDPGLMYMSSVLSITAARDMNSRVDNTPQHRALNILELLACNHDMEEKNEEEE